MTASARRARQREISLLLDELEDARRRVYRLKAGGARAAGLRDLKDELEQTRLRLLEAVG